MGKDQEVLEMTPEQLTNGMPAQNTEEKSVPLNDFQKGKISAAMQTRRYFQQKAQEAMQAEGDIVSIIIDNAGLDNEKVAGAKVSEDGNNLLVSVVVE